MMRVESDDARIVAVLHDVVEDTSVTIDDLRQAGFSEAILAAVRCVTHTKDDSYTDDVIRCRHNEIARQVKLADLHDNSRLERTILRPQRFEADVARPATTGLPDDPRPARSVEVESGGAQALQPDSRLWPRGPGSC